MRLLCLKVLIMDMVKDMDRDMVDNQEEALVKEAMIIEMLADINNKGVVAQVMEDKVLVEVTEMLQKLRPYSLATSDMT